MNYNIKTSPIKSWCIGQALTHSKRTIFFTIFATMVMGSGIRFLIMDDDMMKMLPEHLDSRRTWTLFKMNLEAQKSFLSHLGIKGNQATNLALWRTFGLYQMDCKIFLQSWRYPILLPPHASIL